MADLTTNIDQVSQSVSQRETQINALFDAASPATIFGRRASTCAALVFGYYGGRFNGTTVANGTVTATDDATNYVVVHRGTLAVSISTSTTNWNNTTTYGRAYKLTAADGAITDYEDHRGGSSGIQIPVGATAAVIQAAASDETTALTTGAGKLTFRMPHAMTLTEVRASLTTASSSGDVEIDVNESGASVFDSNGLTIDQGDKTSVGSGTPAVITDASLADDAEITVDIVSAGTGAAGLKVTLIGTR